MMKRSNDEISGSSPKRPHTSQSGLGNVMLVRLLLPSKFAGSIIGRGGHNISRLRQEFHWTLIQLPDCEGPERMFCVTADKETALRVISQIIPCLAEGPMRTVDVHVLVHQSQIGCVIGTQGSKVAEIRMRTSAKIKVFNKCCPQSTDRIVSLVGSSEVAFNALREVVEILESTPPTGYQNPYQPINFEEDISEEYGGFGIPTSAPLFLSTRTWYNSVFFGGHPMRVTIPNNLAGIVIGRGGRTIQRIRSASGACVQVLGMDEGASHRVVTMAGRPERVQHATYLIQQALKNHMVIQAERFEAGRPQQ